MDKLLKISAAKVFNLIITLPFIVLFILAIVVSAANQDNPILRDGIFLVIPITFGIFLFSWIWVSGINLNRYVAKEIRPKATLFKLAFIYIIPFFILDTFGIIPVISAYVLLKILAMASAFYCIYFVANNLEMAERNKVIALRDIWKTILDVWILPIGIWRIQPRINEQYELQNTHNNTSNATP